MKSERLILQQWRNKTLHMRSGKCWPSVPTVAQLSVVYVPFDYIVKGQRQKRRDFPEISIFIPSGKSHDLKLDECGSNSPRQAGS
ncbi:hypothetical protein TNCV_2858661 [Trichonephila clavipes]|nr:hypothetical protein TNCV_2858661 [Trichonephila clavipes]